jgi:hypothetical protein
LAEDDEATSDRASRVQQLEDFAREEPSEHRELEPDARQPRATSLGEPRRAASTA